MPRRHLHKRQRLPPTEGGCEHELSGGRPPPRPMLMEIENYSSSHKDWSCWAGLHPPSKADALCAIPLRAPRLCASDRLTRRRGGAESARRSCKVCQTGLHPSLETSASRATSRRRRGGHGMPCPTPVAGSGRLARHGRPNQGSMYLRTAINPLYRASRGAEALG